ncbi:MAG: hypoxanthine phosphoribosyltransferase [Bacteroidaceae bacterium]|nr:hypoxanthine phosphoribosyltransferase [Bacteroidaceae bacterium]
MEIVEVRDKKFSISIPAEEIQKRIKELGASISSDLNGRKPIFLAVLNGSFVFAADLLREITIPCEISFIRMASYSGTSSTGQVKEVMGLNESLKGRTVVIIEDIIDSGLTMQELVALLQKEEPSEIRIASLLVKPNNLKVSLDIPYCCFKIPNDFIVGYGLDYDGEGRNLKDIYTVVE